MDPFACPSSERKISTFTSLAFVKMEPFSFSLVNKTMLMILRTQVKYRKITDHSCKKRRIVENYKHYSFSAEHFRVTRFVKKLVVLLASVAAPSERKGGF